MEHTYIITPMGADGSAQVQGHSHLKLVIPGQKVAEEKRALVGKVVRVAVRFRPFV